jgi:L-amino acid N-acyltransferase YncA
LPTFLLRKPRFRIIYDESNLADNRAVAFNDLTENGLAQLNLVYNDIVEEGKYLLRNEGPSSVEKARRWLRQPLQTGLAYVAVKVKNRLVGEASIEPREGRASHIAYLDFPQEGIPQSRNKDTLGKKDYGAGT